jgi:hypothetical protein
MRVALPDTYISATQFPRTFAYVARFHSAFKAARSVAPKPKAISGPQVVGYMSQASFHDSIVGEFDAMDPLELEPQQQVTVWPTDTGSANRDTGKLVALTPTEVVLEKKAAMGGFDVRVHFPRWGFRVAKAKTSKV